MPQEVRQNKKKWIHTINSESQIRESGIERAFRTCRRHRLKEQMAPAALNRRCACGSGTRGCACSEPAAARSTRGARTRSPRAGRTVSEFHGLARRDARAPARRWRRNGMMYRDARWRGPRARMGRDGAARSARDDPHGRRRRFAGESSWSWRQLGHRTVVGRGFELGDGAGVGTDVGASDDAQRGSGRASAA